MGTAMALYLATWSRIRFDRRAITALEYALIAGVIVGAITVGFAILANSASTKFGYVGSRL